MVRFEGPNLSLGCWLSGVTTLCVRPGRSPPARGLPEVSRLPALSRLRKLGGWTGRVALDTRASVISFPQSARPMSQRGRQPGKPSNTGPGLVSLPTSGAWQAACSRPRVCLSWLPGWKQTEEPVGRGECVGTGSQEAGCSGKGARPGGSLSAVSPSLPPLPPPHREQTYHGAARRVSLSRDVVSLLVLPTTSQAMLPRGVDPDPLRVGPGPRVPGRHEQMQRAAHRVAPAPWLWPRTRAAGDRGPVREVGAASWAGSPNHSVRFGRDGTAPTSGPVPRATSALSLSEAWGPRRPVSGPWRVLLCAGHSAESLCPSIIFLEGSTVPPLE